MTFPGDLVEITTRMVELVAGRRVNGRCTTATKKTNNKPRCDRSLARGTLTRSAKAKRTTIAFTGKLNGHTLEPGRYRVVVTALADGKASKAATISFTIVR